MAVPLNRRDGSYFGTLCALDPLPATLAEADFAVFQLLAQLIAFELEADERQQQREAELRALEDFIAIAAHDLRQPLTAVYGRAQLLTRQMRNGKGAADLAGGIEHLLGQARRAVQLSDLLLDVARIEAGGFQLDTAPCDLVAVARQALDDAQFAAPAYTFEFTAPATLPLVADAPRLGQVLRNLLDNGVKYSPDRRGPITLTVQARPGEARVYVQDSGIGVPSDQIAHLFTRHYRADNAVARHIGGTGLGLYIAQQIVAAHGGRIAADTPAGGGLRVCLTLPRS